MSEAGGLGRQTLGSPLFEVEPTTQVELARRSTSAEPSGGDEFGLAEPEIQFYRALQRAPEPVFVQIHEKFAWVNTATLRFFGAQTAAELIGTPILDRIHPSGRALTLSRMRRMNQGAVAQEPVEQTCLRLDGTVIVAEVSASGLTYRGERGALVFARDITAARRAEAALRENEHTLRLFAQHAPAALAMFDRQMRFLEVSRRWLSDRGIEAEDVRGRTLRSVHPNLPERWQERHARAMAGEVVRIEEDLLERADGRTIWVRWEARPWMNEAGEIAGLLVFSEDITARKNAEKELRDTESRYRNLVETSFDWVWEIDAAGTYVYASPRVRTLLGLRPEDTIGRNVFDLVAEEKRAVFASGFRRVLATRCPFSGIEKVVRHASGKTLIFETSGVPVIAADGSFAGYRGTDRDVTVRVLAERTLRLHDEALKAAANAIVITDRSGVIEWANPAFTKLSGWNIAEAIGKTPGQLVKSGKQDRAFYSALWKTIATGNVWHGEVVNRRKDGALRTEDMTITPLRDENGRVAHFIAIKQDVTDRKALEAHLLQSQRMESIGTLAAGIAHDINNLLAPILLVGGMLQQGAKDKSGPEGQMLEIVHTSATRAAEVIRQLLTFSRGQPGQRGPFPLSSLFKEISGILKETFPRNIEVSCGGAIDLWPIVGNPTQLHQVVLNLCLNARDAMPNGGQLVITAENCPADSPLVKTSPGLTPGDYVAIEVRDTGAGIPNNIRERIFDPFFTTKPVGKGTGLGLSSALGIVREHGGSITVESASGQGSLFRVFIPASRQGAAAQVVAPERPPPAPVSPMTVLVVDDEQNVRHATRLLLGRANYRVLTATDGVDALSQFMAHRTEVRVVLTDLMMPLMDGDLLIRALRALDANVEIVVTTGFSDVIQDGDLKALGVRHVLPKPADPSVLVALLAEVAASRGSATAP